MPTSSSRILTMDIIRGIAIIFMTIYHQRLIFQPEDLSGTIAYFLGYLAAPFFLAVSGMVMFLHEEKHRWPFKMIVHGSVLFAMAWSIDVIYHRSFAVDWDIFQLIGAGYVFFGVLNYLDSKIKKYAALAALILVWSLIKDIRPDDGIFPIWPYGVFFLGGYSYIQYTKRGFNWQLKSALLFAPTVAYIAFWIFIGRLPSIVALSGIILALSLTFILASIGLYGEEKKPDIFHHAPLTILNRFGVYPLSLYMCQQVITRLGMSWRYHLRLTEQPFYDWIIQATMLLLGMLLLTFLFDHFKYVSLEWWLRQTEIRLLRRMPAKSIFAAHTLSY